MHAEAIKLDPSSAAKRLMFNNRMQLTSGVNLQETRTFVRAASL
jgi:hypothetical protein